MVFDLKGLFNPGKLLALIPTNPNKPSHPKNPDPSKVASYWGPKNTTALEVQTSRLEGPMILRATKKG